MRLVTAAVVSALGVAAITAASTTAVPPCSARPVVAQFVAALNAGDLGRVDELFARGGERWSWYSVADLAGQRLGADAQSRSSLPAYFAARARRHEQLRLLSLGEGGNGNFSLVLMRRADDLRDGRPVERIGKGWVNCAVGKIAVWSLGGAPPPETFGPCPRAALVIARTGLASAGRAVLRFVDRTYSEMAPGLDVHDAKITSAVLAPGEVKGYAARVACGRELQRRTAIVEVRFPHIAQHERLSTVAFYASLTSRGWRVWRLIP